MKIWKYFDVQVHLFTNNFWSFLDVYPKKWKPFTAISTSLPLVCPRAVYEYINFQKLDFYQKDTILFTLTLSRLIYEYNSLSYCRM